MEPRSPDFNIYSLYKIPRMGLALIGTAARQAGYNVRIVYQEAVPLRHRDLVWADLVGFSVITSTAPEGYRLARVARAVSRSRGRELPIVFGGVHPTFAPEEAMAEADYVLRGEADLTFVPFLEALFAGDQTALAGIPGLCRREEGRVVQNPLEERKVDLDRVPSPDWSLLEGYPYSGTGIAMTSRGCPFDCSFCSVTAMLGRKYRMRSIDRIMEDLAGIRQRHVFFYDDNFAANPARTKELLRRIIAERGRTHHLRTFSTQVRSDIARDPELLDLMKQAGCSTLYIGFESVNPETLELFHKQQTLEEIGTAIREIHRRGIEIHGMFVFGSDADAEETFWTTVRFARSNRIETVQFMILTPLPGSRQYYELEAEGRILCQEWNRYDAHNAVFLPKHMSPYRLQMGTIRAMQRFYSLAGILPWLLRGNFMIALLRAFAWWTLKRWLYNNRRRLEALKRDTVDIFVPELMRAICPRPELGGPSPAGAPARDATG